MYIILYLNIFYVQANRKVVEYNNWLSIESSGEGAGDRKAVRTRAHLALKRLEK